MGHLVMWWSLGGGGAEQPEDKRRPEEWNLDGCKWCLNGYSWIIMKSWMMVMIQHEQECIIMGPLLCRRQSLSHKNARPCSSAFTFLSFLCQFHQWKQWTGLKRAPDQIERTCQPIPKQYTDRLSQSNLESGLVIGLLTMMCLCCSIIASFSCSARPICSSDQLEEFVFLIRPSAIKKTSNMHTFIT